MRAVILVLLLLAATIGLMLQIRSDSGYVLLSYGQYSLETSLVVLLVALGLAFAVLYFLLRSLVRALHIPQQARDFKQKRQRTQAAKGLQQGLLQLAEGRWAESQKSLARHADHSELGIVHYLNAARAAQLANDNEGRDAWLAKAYEANPQAEVAIGLVKAELQRQAQQPVFALATLRHLREKHPKHPYVLRMLAQTHSELGEWQELEQLVGELEQHKAFEADKLFALRQQLWGNRLEQITQQALEGRREIAAEHTAALWKKTNRQERNDAECLVHFAKAHHASGNDSQAADLLESVLKKQWQQEAVELYGWLELPQARALKTIEQWLKHHGDQAAVLLTAAQVCIRYQLWGRARSWLNHLSTTQPSEAAWKELAALEEQQGNYEAAAKAWRAAASMSGQTVAPLLPQPSSKPSNNDNVNSQFRQPDIAGPECLDEKPNKEEQADKQAAEPIQLPVTPAAAYSNESKNN